MRKIPALAAALLAAWALAAPAAAPHAVQFVGSYTWPASAHHLGGFSGLELADDGKTFTVISDRGDLLTGTFKRRDRKIAGLSTSAATRLTDHKGRALKGWKTDSEGLAIRPDGRVFISFEGEHRVWAYGGTQKEATRLPQHQAFRSLQGNSGIEALAINAKGHLFAIPERSGKLTRPFPVWRFNGKGWSQPFSLRRSGGFLPVGADFGPDGMLYLLEREFTGIGFRSRVRRFDIDGAKVKREETLFETGVWRHDNLEGLSVWRDSSGDIRLTMISDDNFRTLQRTEFVEYRVLKN
ncbi:MAG: esterase-like activity of phytase family protein [Pelagimonas sp.]|uniref:esterase-like activity of phytase family protein n=1 Tax=Pelagimonas sp. TaxID=2073170 RepID=UPI003D6B036E